MTLMKRPPLNSEWFREWSEAFDYCRDMDQPVIVAVPYKSTKCLTEYAKIFPSGQCVTLFIDGKIER
jgi:hypothetical protein